MKKHLLLIPSLVAITATPFISLTSCFESEEDDPKPGPTPPEGHKVKVDPNSDTNNISISSPTITLNKDLVIEYHMKNPNKQIDFSESWVLIDSECYYLNEYHDYDVLYYLFFDDKEIKIPFELVTTYDITVCLFSEDKQANTMTVNFNSINKPDLWYSTDGTKWDPVTESGEITLNGDELWLKGNNPEGFSSGYDVYSHTNIQLKGNIHLKGNCMDLIDDDVNTNNIDVIPCDHCFANLFSGSTGLRSIPSNYLSASNLTQACYQYMFQGCTWLSSLPNNLFAPASKDYYCFEGMFEGCKRLTSLPEGFFPYDNFTEYLCDSMFLDCYWLTSLPKDLFRNIVSIDYGSCQDMFSGCVRLTSLPDNLPRAGLSWGCYQWMFAYCYSLTSLPPNFFRQTDYLESYCYENMFYRCESLKIRVDVGDPDKKIFSCPAYDAQTIFDPVEGMFAYTGGEFTGTPTPSHTYYWYE